MRRNNTTWRPLETAELDWSDTGAPRSRKFGDVYFSGEGDLEESEYVFLRGNRLTERLSDHAHPHFCIVETGFGTGLNFLQTWASWRALPASRPRMHYVSIEKHPLSPKDLARALSRWPTLAALSSQLHEYYPEPIPGTHRIVLEHGALILDLWWEDVLDTLPELAAVSPDTVDAWYLDGFAPARNADMWHESLFTDMATASRKGATLASFTAAGDVRRGLTRAGFEITKVPGFGRKRECIEGRISSNTPYTLPPGTPWDISRRSNANPRSAIIIGAGLAGCATAAALARRGINVTLLEQSTIAGAGSGNNQGVLYTRLSARHSPLSDFALQSFWYAQSFYRHLFHSGVLQSGDDGELCGSFHQSDRLEEMAKLVQCLGATPALAQVFGSEEASEVLGIKQAMGGYWFPRSGWLSPAAVCRALADSNRIVLEEDTGEITLLPNEGGGWCAFAGDRLIASSDCAIIAAGTSSTRHHQLSWLPLQAIRGQTTNLPGSAVFNQLRAAFCHTGYISPPRAGSHCIGATFDLNDDDTSIRQEDHRRNLAALADAIPPWREEIETIEPTSLSGRVGFRCATPDYLPMVGAVPNHPAFLQSYGALRKNAKQEIQIRGEYLPDLYVTTGHGSRGLTSTPLAAEILASQICGEALPLSREMLQAIAPARFIIRQLKRGLA